MKQQGRYTFEGPWPQVAEALEEFHRADKSAEGTRRKMLWAAGGVLLTLLAACAVQSGGLVMAAGFISLFLGIGVFAPLPAIARFVFLAVPGFMLVSMLETPLQRVLVLPLAALLVAWILMAKYDLDDSRLGAPRRFLDVARTDLRSDRPVKVALDLRHHRHRAFLQPVPGPTKNYRCRWLELEARLADGSAVAVSVERDVKRKEKPKRKYTKVKERLQDRIDLVLRPAGKANLEVLQRDVPPNLQVRSVAVQGDRLVASLVTPVALSLTNRAGTTETGHQLLAGGDTILGALVWLYRGARQETAASAS